VTDEKYLTSLLWDQSFYGTPRSASLTLSWKY
jgi:outer membrane receptor for ferric coprogen and ferric-rhodotorulic acid